jgi:hypothetical protein
MFDEIDRANVVDNNPKCPNCGSYYTANDYDSYNFFAPYTPDQGLVFYLAVIILLSWTIIVPIFMIWLYLDSFRKREKIDKSLWTCKDCNYHFKKRALRTASRA